MRSIRCFGFCHPAARANRLRVQCNAGGPVQLGDSRPTPAPPSAPPDLSTLPPTEATPSCRGPEPLPARTAASRLGSAFPMRRTPETESEMRHVISMPGLWPKTRLEAADIFPKLKTARSALEERPRSLQGNQNPKAGSVANPLWTARS
jgi:hypothetical protein